MIDLTDARALSGLVIDGQLRANRGQVGEAIAIEETQALKLADLASRSIYDGIACSGLDKVLNKLFAEAILPDLEKMLAAARLEALEEAAKIAETGIAISEAVPCPDGIAGCLVVHRRNIMRHMSAGEIAAAIRQKAKE
jgi:hypothetical protein